MADVASDAAGQITDLDAQLDQHTRALDVVLGSDAEAGIRLDDETHLGVPPLEAETVDDAASAGHIEITNRMPEIDLVEVLADMEQFVGLGELFTHAAGQTNRMPELNVHLFAAILAHGSDSASTVCPNLGSVSRTTQMGEHVVSAQ